MNQIVYVVIDNDAKKVIGAFNDFDVAKLAAEDAELPIYCGDEISITPVLVDHINPLTAARKFWLDDESVYNATANEIELANPFSELYDEDEDEEDEDEEDELPF